MPKKLITHINPHLDDIVGMWLVRRYHPSFKNTALGFIPQGRQAESTNDELYIGTGLGKFDEHKGDHEESAATLVWKWLKSERNSPENTTEKKAVEQIVHYTFLADTATLPFYEYREFGVGGIISGYHTLSRDSDKTTRFAFDVLDGLLEKQKKEITKLDDWKHHVDFESMWGKAAYIKAPQNLSEVAYAKGYKLIVGENSKKGYKTFSAAADSDVDLTETYNKLRSIDPDSVWFLHHSKKMLLSGSDVIENKNLSKLSLAKLVELVQK